MRIAPIAPIAPTARLSDFGHKPTPSTHGHCDECKAPMKDIGGYGYSNFRCIARGCSLSAFKPINPASTTFAARNWI